MHKLHLLSNQLCSNIFSGYFDKCTCVYAKGIPGLIKRENNLTYYCWALRGKTNNVAIESILNHLNRSQNIFLGLCHVTQLHSPRIDLTVAGLNGVHVPETERIT